MNDIISTPLTPVPTQPSNGYINTASLPPAAGSVKTAPGQARMSFTQNQGGTYGTLPGAAPAPAKAPHQGGFAPGGQGGAPGQRASFVQQSQTSASPNYGALPGPGPAQPAVLTAPSGGLPPGQMSRPSISQTQQMSSPNYGSLPSTGAPPGGQIKQAAPPQTFAAPGAPGTQPGAQSKRPMSFVQQQSQVSGQANYGQLPGPGPSNGGTLGNVTAPAGRPSVSQPQQPPGGAAPNSNYGALPARAPAGPAQQQQQQAFPGMAPNVQTGVAMPGGFPPTAAPMKNPAPIQSQSGPGYIDFASLSRPASAAAGIGGAPAPVQGAGAAPLGSVTAPSGHHAPAPPQQILLAAPTQSQQTNSPNCTLYFSHLTCQNSLLSRFRFIHLFAAAPSRLCCIWQSRDTTAPSAASNSRQCHVPSGFGPYTKFYS